MGNIRKVSGDLTHEQWKRDWGKMNLFWFSKGARTQNLGLGSLCPRGLEDGLGGWAWDLRVKERHLRIW